MLLFKNRLNITKCTAFYIDRSASKNFTRHIINFLEWFCVRNMNHVRENLVCFQLLAVDGGDFTELRRAGDGQAAIDALLASIVDCVGVVLVSHCFFLLRFSGFFQNSQRVERHAIVFKREMQMGACGRARAFGARRAAAHANALPG